MRNSYRALSAPFDSIHEDDGSVSISSPSSAIHAALRQRTAILHRNLEERLDLLAPTLSLARYRRLLLAFYGFYVPVEATLVQLAPSASPLLAFPLAARAPLLLRDLLALGSSNSEMKALAPCSRLPRLVSSQDLAGCLYVLEGAALGGRLISRSLAQNLGIDKDSGGSFFVGYGNGTAARWKSVLLWLGGFDDRIDEVVHAACDTFSTLGSWLEAQGAMR